MDSSFITFEQARILHAQVAAHLCYFGRLQRRMERLGFPPDDVLYRHVVAAYNSAHALMVQAHYLSVQSGVGNRKVNEHKHE
jgi:hypothetical protein